MSTAKTEKLRRHEFGQPGFARKEQERLWKYKESLRLSTNYCELLGITKNY